MSFDPNTPLPADRKVRTSKRLWSDVVGEAEAEAGITASADDARSRAEQLRGLFDSARNDAAQDEAATEAGRNA